MVELSNLQRQIAHGVADIGTPKVDSAAQAIRAINPGVTVQPHRTRITAANALELIAGYDIICDGSDNFPTRFLVADACVLAKRTLVSAAVLRFEGQLSTFKPHASGPSCGEAGVLGAVTGVMGTLQATEVLKEITGVGETLAGRLLIWDALATRFRTIRVPSDPACPACGPHATLHDLSAHTHQAEAPTCAV